LTAFTLFLLNQNCFAKNIKVDYKNEIINLEFFSKLKSHITKQFPKSPVNCSSGDVECYQLDENEKLIINEYSNKINQKSVSCGNISWVNSPDLTEICFTDILKDHWFV